MYPITDMMTHPDLGNNNAPGLSQVKNSLKSLLAYKNLRMLPGDTPDEVRLADRTSLSALVLWRNHLNFHV